MVREALRGLSILGVVESRQGGRCYVTDLAPARLVAPLQMVIAIDETNVDALYEARVAVEGEIVRLAATRATPDDLAVMADLVTAGYSLTADPVGFRVMDHEFHATLSRIGGNPFLERAARSLYELGMEYRRVASDTPGVVARSAVEHEAIVTALRTRDPEKAAVAMRAHLSSISRTTHAAMIKLGAARRPAECGVVSRLAFLQPAARRRAIHGVEHLDGAHADDAVGRDFPPSCRGRGRREARPAASQL